MHEETYTTLFKAGDETALSYMYSRYYQPLLHHGKKIVDDEFMVSCMLQEAFLKGWQFRHIMENQRHIYCFIRLNLTWQCYHYLRNPARKLYDPIPEYMEVADSSNWLAEQDETSAAIFDESRLQLIEAAIPYLPPNRQTILSLYFKYGFSYKKIARRFATSNTAVHIEIIKGLEQLKKIIHHKKKSTTGIATVTEKKQPPDYSSMMPPEMWHIFQYRYEQKMGFEKIAEKMNLEPVYIRQQYIEAHKKLNTLKKRA